MRETVGSSNDYPVSSPDLMATLLQALDSKPAKEQIVDGLSLIPLLQQQALPERDLYWFYPHYGNQGGAPAAAVRRGSWKWIHWLEDDREELFDLAADPGEQVNLLASRAELALSMKAAWDAWANEVNVQYPTKNDRYDPDKKSGRAADRPQNLN
jgi:arylsulfatase A-like enzyme